MTQQTVNTISEEFRAFAKHIVDYAGLFPPASLDLETVVENYVTYLNGPNSWILGKLICPLKRFNELGQLLEKYSLENPIQVVGLVTEEKQADDIHNKIQRFEENYGHLAKIVSIEAKFEQNLMHSEHLVPLFVETSHSRDVEIIADAHCNLKIRCGGLTPEDFPSAEDLAKMIYLAKEFEVTMKFTAGLHHPIRHYSEEVKCKVHGFVNVFSAVIFSYEHKLDEESTKEILEEENPKNFYFDNNAYFWKNLSVSKEAIETSRQYFAQSFGSCSFDEPINDLKTLGWIS